MALRNQEIGARLRELRGEKPQTVVADELGVAERTYQNWEGGDAKPSYRNLQRLADYYGVGEDFILTGEGAATANGGDADLTVTPTPFAGQDALADRLDQMEALIGEHAAALREHNELLRRQSEILERIEAAIDREEAAARRDEESARRLDESVQRARQALRDGTPDPPRAGRKSAPKSTLRA